MSLIETSAVPTASLGRSDLRALLGLDPVAWMMAPSERLALVGLLVALRPARTLELGCAHGGLTTWLSHLSGQVITVDIDARVEAIARELPNVEGWCMSSDAASRKIEAEGLRFDLTVVDADHSEAGVRRDLESALGFSEVIVVHDTYHPPCRAGILAALRGRDVFSDLDVVPGGLQPDGQWGGLGFVIPGLPRTATLSVTPRRSMYETMRKLSEPRGWTHAYRRMLTRWTGQTTG